jgi:hypothetical protein
MLVYVQHIVVTAGANVAALCIDAVHVTPTILHVHALIDVDTLGLVPVHESRNVMTFFLSLNGHNI